MAAATWSTQQLAEFVAAVSAAESEPAAALAAVERAAEALDSDAAAIVGGGKVLATVGFPRGAAPVADLEAVKSGRGDCSLEVPGVGPCAATAAALEHPPGATLVVARAGVDGLTTEEAGLLRGMARVASLTMRMQRLLDGERVARKELERFVREQAALRRVATLVAEAASPDAVFAAVAEEVGRVAGADVALVARYADDAIEFVGGWSNDGDISFVGRKVQLGGNNVTSAVFETNAPARVDYRPDDVSPATALAREWASSSAGAPISVEGRLWGVMLVGSRHGDALPSGVEYELADFTELVATAVANAQTREDLRVIADEQAALRRVATLVAEGASPEEIFTAVVDEVARILGLERIEMARYEADGTATVIAASGDHPFPPGSRWALDGPSVLLLVQETGRAVRIDDYGDLPGTVAAVAREAGFRSAIGAPIIVGGRTWGAIIAISTEPEPIPDRWESRLAQFTDLVATAIANAQARDELREVADDQAALRRVATLVARGAAPGEIFDAVAKETRAVLGVDSVALLRPESDGTVMVLAVDSAHPEPRGIPVGGRFTPEPNGVIEPVLRTGRPSRIDAPEGDVGRMAQLLRAGGNRGAVGAPIVVDGRPWGVMLAVWKQEGVMQAGGEERLVQFTELVATAVANTQAQAELTASRARIIATADETRRRIERDLHDGAQQRLVTLGLRLRTAQAAVPPELEELAAELDDVARGLSSALDELREFARGIHPAILVEGGLARALRSLARRSAVPVELNVHAGASLPEPIEVAAYYVVSEALANVAKHADASTAAVDVEPIDGVVRVSVRDDGIGGADFAPGSGLVGLKDRVEALGGRISLESQRGAGTAIEVELPLPAESE